MISLSLHSSTKLKLTDALRSNKVLISILKQRRFSLEEVNSILVPRMPPIQMKVKSLSLEIGMSQPSPLKIKVLKQEVRSSLILVFSTCTESKDHSK